MKPDIKAAKLVSSNSQLDGQESEGEGGTSVHMFSCWPSVIICVCKSQMSLCIPQCLEGLF
ncbi:rCG42142 [Rattus norvegicus]|uniref:RCG42142 n=1 Tax=Rattus norvegicus TaxID=10116 RepID=A6K059_RAT|nr:rCG42142 [Rattus norvegicus]